MTADRVDIGTLGLQPIGLSKLANDLLRRMPLPLLKVTSSPIRAIVTLEGVRLSV
jgi:hypothetical protein